MGQDKGRGTIQAGEKNAGNIASSAQGAASTAAGLGTADAGKQANYAATADPFVKSLIPGKNGALSPYAQAQYDQAKANIDKTYQSNAEAALRGAAQRGMGGAPTGLSASIANTANEGKGAAETNAYQNAQQGTLASGLQGVNYEQNQQQIYNPLNALSTEGGLLNAGTNAAGEQVNAGVAKNNAGNVFTDIGAGLKGFAGLVPGGG